MNCIKTGAVVELTEYSTKIVADLYEVGNTIVIDFNGEIYGLNRREPTHQAVIGSLGYQNKSKGIFVIPKSQIQPIPREYSCIPNV